jgi:2-methylcitrate dehydratase PrpD
MTDVSIGLQQALTLSHQLARHVAMTPFTSIPQSALDAAKLFPLDTLAVAWAGSNAPGCREAHALVAEEGGRSSLSAA